MVGGASLSGLGNCVIRVTDLQLALQKTAYDVAVKRQGSSTRKRDERSKGKGIG